jgi:hypothetical protein
MCVARKVVPSLRDSLGIASSTRHFRDGFSHTAASRLEFGDSIPPVSPGVFEFTYLGR